MRAKQRRELDSLVAVAEFNLLLHHLVLYFQQLFHLSVAILNAQHDGIITRDRSQSVGGGKGIRYIHVWVYSSKFVHAHLRSHIHRH